MRHLLTDTRIIAGRCIRQTAASKIGLLFGLLQPLLFLLFFGPLLEDLSIGGDGDSWQTLVPGLLVQLSLFSSAFAGFTLLMEKHHGVVERMRVTPVSRLALLLGRLVRDVLQLSVQSALLVLVGVAMGLRAPLAGILLGFALVGLLAAALAALSYALAMRVSTPQEFAPVINSLNMPAMLLSGVLLPMTLAPGWLDAVSRCVPFRYVVEAVRDAYTGDYTDGTLALGTAVAVALAAAALALGTRVFRRAGA
ncbi:ABC transporter permease [Streptomyces qinglanensis]|uniref:Transport permease protein n=1 Tax=Streptomyces qinglanensis TaxID=943816 RepID=A0A1H9V3N4_9ACTN|nr:ABC transporter permease [Streptomyces qinglanensis]SES16282.1 ABC-2 type transport system permease protein [Streptomyces qinglanensis]